MRTHDVRATGRVRRTGGFALAAALLLSGAAWADDVGAQVDVGVKDVDIRQDVADAVLSYVHYGVFDSVGVGVQDGVVTLKGSVLQPYRRQDIERLVSRLEGVRQIRNEIRVQPVSTFDDRLRLQLYNQIYGRGLLQRFASMASPPVHIVVENGNITLTGVVGSQVEKVSLEHAARGLLAFRVDNQVEIEGETAKPRART